MSDAASHENAAQPVRTRSRLALQAGNRAAPGATGLGPKVGGLTKPLVSWGRRGADADAAALRAQEERQAMLAERAAMRRMPRRFDVQKGGSADIILLDDDFGFQITEHEKWDDQQKRYVFESCPGEYAHCVVCADAELGRSGKLGFRRKNVVDMLTCIDLTPFEVKTGPDRGKTIQASRRLLPLKPGDRDKFKQLQQEYGSLRGLHVLMTRGFSDEESRLGQPEVIAQMTEEELVDEPTLQEQMGEYRDENGFVIRAEGELIQSFDWETLFPAPDPELLMRKYGGAAPAGSRMANRQASNDSEWGDFDPGRATRGQPNLDLDVAANPPRQPQTTPEGAGRTRLQRRGQTTARNATPTDPDDGRFAPPPVDDAEWGQGGGAVPLDDDIPFA